MTPRQRSQRRASRARPQPETVDAIDRGQHTLRIERGVVVGVDAPDVFVELGPRVQGVIGLDRFESTPEVGSAYDFTLRGQEEGLWALELAPTAPSPSWERMEVGALLEARAVAVNAGGLELKAGRLHGFMPRSECGLGRRGKPNELVGSRFLCEVVDIDAERQRLILSRKSVLRREREGQHRDALRLRVGQRVEGRVSKLLPFGAAIRFGAGLEGLLHVADIDHERVRDPAERLAPGQRVDLVVLSIKRGGRRIALGIKQLTPSPWGAIERRMQAGNVLRGEVTRVADFGVFVRLAPGIVGLLHRSEADLGGRAHPRQTYREGQEVAIRVLSVDAERERASLSSFHPSGRPVSIDEVHALEDMLEEAHDSERNDLEPDQPRDPAAGSSHFGRILHRALDATPRDE